MATLERTYIIPLRKDYSKVPKYYRSKRAINFIKRFIERHTKAKDVKLGRELNKFVWAHGIKNPPTKVKVKVVVEDSRALVELEGHDYKVDKIQSEKSDQPSTLKDKISSALGKDSKDEDSDKPTPKEPEKEEKPKAAKKEKPSKKTSKSK